MRLARLRGLFLAFGLFFALLAPAVTRAGGVLIVIAHPDDESMMGSALGRLKELGIPVHLICVTDGEGGQIWTPLREAPSTEWIQDFHSVRLPREVTAKFRAEEFQKAREAYGIQEFIRLGEEDRAFSGSFSWNTDHVNQAISEAAERIQPEIVLTLLPKKYLPAEAALRLHPHHQEVGAIVENLAEQGKLGSALHEVFAVTESAWYPAEFFPAVPGQVAFSRETYSPILKQTYAEFQLQGVIPHQSQKPAYRGLLSMDEVYQPLFVRPGSGARPGRWASWLAPEALCNRLLKRKSGE